MSTDISDLVLKYSRNLEPAGNNETVANSGKKCYITTTRLKKSVVDEAMMTSPSMVPPGIAGASKTIWNSRKMEGSWYDQRIY